MVYVAYSPSKGVIVSHQGTNTSSFASILNDANFTLDPVNSRLSYLGSGIKVHGGFQDTCCELRLCSGSSQVGSFEPPRIAVLTVGTLSVHPSRSLMRFTSRTSSRPTRSSRCFRSAKDG